MTSSQEDEEAWSDGVLILNHSKRNGVSAGRKLGIGVAGVEQRERTKTVLYGVAQRWSEQSIHISRNK